MNFRYNIRAEQTTISALRPIKSTPLREKPLRSAQTVTHAFGYSFTGWSDGEKTYMPGDTLVMPEGGITLTATWKEGGTYFSLETCDSNEGWWGTHDIFNGTDSPKEGSGYNGTRGNEVLIFCKMFDSPYDISTFEATGFYHLWFWVKTKHCFKQIPRIWG